MLDERMWLGTPVKTPVSQLNPPSDVDVIPGGITFQFL